SRGRNSRCPSSRRRTRTRSFSGRRSPRTGCGAHRESLARRAALRYGYGHPNGAGRCLTGPRPPDTQQPRHTMNAKILIVTTCLVAAAALLFGMALLGGSQELTVGQLLAGQWPPASVPAERVTQTQVAL